MTNFPVACISLTPAPRDIDENADKVIEWTAKAAAAGAKLALFPEAFLSACLSRPPRETALPFDSPMLRKIQSTAEKAGIIISIGFLELEGNAIHISQAYLGRGVREIFRKCHLTETEKKFAKPGNAMSPQDLGFVRVGTQICRDSAFPRASETLVLKGAEILFSPTSHAYDWEPAESHEHAHAIQKRRSHVCKYWRARAYDYTCYAIYVDMVGTTPNDVWFPGYIGVFGPDGEIVAESISGQEAMVVAALDGQFLARCRKEWVGHYQTMADSRPELYL
jgi:predicted amidohydrolase